MTHGLDLPQQDIIQQIISLSQTHKLRIMLDMYPEDLTLNLQN